MGEDQGGREYGDPGGLLPQAAVRKPDPEQVKAEGRGTAPHDQGNDLHPAPSRRAIRFLPPAILHQMPGQRGPYRARPAPMARYQPENSQTSTGKLLPSRDRSPAREHVSPARVAAGPGRRSA